MSWKVHNNNQNLREREKNNMEIYLRNSCGLGSQEDLDLLKLQIL